MTTALAIDGMDLSHYQDGKVDYGAAKKAGVKFFYHKATEATSYADPNYSRRRAEAKKAGMPFGAYHFARPKVGNAAAEAKHFLDVANPAPGDLCPALDLEDRGGLTDDQLDTWVTTFVDAIKKALKVTPVIYTPFNLKHSHGALLWAARYSNANAMPNVPAPWKHVDIRQFSNGQYGVPNSIPGVGHCDIDHLQRQGLDVGDFTITKGGPSHGTKGKSTGAFRIITQNVQSLPLHPQPEVIHDVDLTASQAGIIGWQEIQPDRYRQVVADLGSKWETYWGEPEGAGHLPTVDWYDSPISWRSKYWDFVDGGKVVMHKGVAKISGTRYATWVLLKHKTDPVSLLVFNGHLTSSPFAVHDVPADQPERQRLWHQDKDILWKLVEVKIAKHPEAAVAITGDFNAMTGRDKKQFEPLVVAGRKLLVCTPPSSIDQIFLANGAGARWDVKDTETLPGRNSDHQGRRVRAALEYGAS